MIYCVEDDRGIRELVVYALQNTGFPAAGFDSSSEFYKAVADTVPELVLLDIMLPGEDGISILKRLRANSATQKIPVIMLTAKSSEYDKVMGLDSGADDYITKPFGIMELISRIRAVLRRTGEEIRADEFAAGDVKLNVSSHSVSVCGEPIDLTLKEFGLLQLLMKNAGIVLSRDSLLEKIWGYDFDGETRTVDVHIRSLRVKLGRKGDIIETVRGVGYRINGSTGENK